MVRNRSYLLFVIALGGPGCNFLMAPSSLQGGSTDGGIDGVPVSLMTRPLHETLFPIATGVHGNADCNSCHGGFATFKEFTCTSAGCHDQAKTDPGHATVTGYKYNSADCLSCHPSGAAGSLSRAAHTFFPIDLASVHATSQCTDCHTNPGDRKQFTCISCHDHAQPVTDMGHAGVVDYKYESASCLSCHPSGIAGTVSRPDHTTKFFPIDVTTVHGAAQCSDCHTNLLDKTQFTCISCHDHAKPVTDTGHAGIANYKYDSASCLSCHPSGIAGTVPRPDHMKFFPIDVGTVHAVAQCTDCHTNLKDKTQFTCLTSGCHVQSLTDTGHVGVANYKFASASCLSCHPQGLAGTISRADHTQFFPIDVGAKHAPQQCTDCHSNLADKTQFTCFNSGCHAQTAVAPGHAGVVGFKYDSASCLSCHPQGLAGLLARPDHAKYIPIDVGTKHATTQCTDCHTNAADRTVFTCMNSACHLQAAEVTRHSGVAVFTWTAASCMTCHPAGAPALTRALHKTYMNISSGNHNVACSHCHKTTNYKVSTCLDCHSSNNPG